MGAIQVWTELSLYKQAPLRQPVFSEDGGFTLTNPATGYAHGLMQNRCQKCVWDYGPGTYVHEFAAALDLKRFREAVEGIRNILRLQGASFPLYGIFIRFSPSSTAMMSIEYGRATVHIEIVTPMRKNPFKNARSGLGSVQAIEQLLISLGGRPHWSMCGQSFHTKSMLAANSPNIAKFRAMMKKYDPNGVFLNKFGERITGASNQLTVDTRAIHCALNSNCICSKNADCATGQICKKMYGFNVCKDVLRQILPLNLFTHVTDELVLRKISNLFAVV
ncbi:L-gulonolactone oxidase 5 [Pseudolycoriella hygida]|uniref:L-gulonolactone oxidase 5 n=1 Tax=Pseudolycoriella hygida TaxID=35572 RepID=A0A9Q0MK23_9DIPT|nr:L-gulonolactone oxidase 5 [Pseudolycoriella hygida]